MNWFNLLCSKRLGIDNTQNGDDNRSPFLVDVDRLIYSAHFRKLQDKTQVHPLSKSDFVRTRLTHSLEVSSVARSLGYNVGQYVLNKNPELSKNNITEHDFGYIVQAAALAHDIGNPPFGHLGEYAISDYYTNLFANPPASLDVRQLTLQEKQNLCNFDGNSQGFRVITNLAGWRNQGGLRLTYATLGAFLKYPRGYASAQNIAQSYNNLSNSIKQQSTQTCLIGHKKTGVLLNEETHLQTIASSLGLANISSTYLLYKRHPLAFLTEAADDICYCIADLEDAFFVGLITLAEVEELLIPIVRRYSKYNGSKEERINALRKESFYNALDSRKKVEFLRGKAVSNLINAVSQEFIAHGDLLLQGTLNNDLLALTEFKEDIAKCKKIAREKIFTSHHKINAEISGIAVINQVMQDLTHLILHPNSTLSRLLLNYLNKNFILENAKELLGENSKLSLYNKFLLINDIVSDFTDRNIFNFNKILKGL